jgi:predicted permease
MKLIRRLFPRRAADRINEELQFHIDEQIASHLAAGMSPAEAARITRLEFGGRQQVKEEIRAGRRWAWLDDARGDVRFALRTYRRTPAFAAMAVLTLALGIGVNTALFTVVREVLIRQLPVANPHELVEIDCVPGPSAPNNRTCMQSYPAFELLRQRHDGLAGIAAFTPAPGGVVAVVDGRREVVTALLASGNMFDVVGVAPQLGRPLVDTDDQPAAPAAAVISHAYWQRAFGGRPEVVGGSFTLGSQDVMIVGVLPRTFRGLAFGENYDVFLPLTAAPQFYPPGILTMANRGWLTFMGRLESGISAEQASALLFPIFRAATEAAIAGVPAEMRQKLNLSAEGFRVDVRTASTGVTSSQRRGLQPTLRTLVPVAGLVLTIACANLAGLFLARALARQKELGLRVALGAGRTRLVRQLFAEILLIVAAGGAVGLLLAQWLAPGGLILAVGDGALDAVDLRPDASMLAFTAAVTVATALLAGFAPILRASSTNAQEALRNATAGSPRWTKGLLTAQVALTIALVGIAGLFLQTLTNFRRIDAGFPAERLLTLVMDVGTRDFDQPRFHSYLGRGREALAALPGVRAVTHSQGSLGVGVGTFFNVAPPGGAPGRMRPEDSAGVAYGGPGYVATTGMTLLSGRDIAETDRGTAPRVAIVNESFARHFFGRIDDVVGRTFSFAPAELNQPFHIIGLVRDARDGGLKRPTTNMMYAAHLQSEVRGTTFVLRTDRDPAGLAASARRTIETLDPGVGVLRMRSVQTQLNEGLRRERLLAALGSVFAGLALLLMAVGLYGMLNGIVVRRTSEIGVRMALGADRKRIGWMLARETLVILAVGIAAGIAGELALGRVVRAELFGVTSTDATAVVGAVGLLLAVSVVAVGIPARRAMRIQPSEALRQDYL